jgi:hypothetical protein
MIKHNIEEEAKLMALPEGTSVTVEELQANLLLNLILPAMKIL